jgi:hypothetical protein
LFAVFLETELKSVFPEGNSKLMMSESTPFEAEQTTTQAAAATLMQNMHRKIFFKIVIL